MSNILCAKNDKKNFIMFLYIKRFFRQLHEFLVDNHHHITILGCLTIFSYMTYHFPAHIRTSNFKTFTEVLSKFSQHFTIGSLEAISALLGFITTFLTIFFYLPYTTYQDVQDLFGFRRQKKYLDDLFTKLMTDCKEIQKFFGDDENRSLDQLQDINEFLIECMDKFRTDADRVLTPTLEELFSDFEVEENFSLV